MRTYKSWIGILLFLFIGCASEEFSDEVIEKIPNPKGTVLFPSGTALVGSKDSTDNIPEKTKSVKAFYLDQTEVTAEDYQRCIDNKQCLPPQEGIKTNSSCVYDLEKGTPVLGKEKHPINCVTFQQATEFCKAQGKRLPTEIEWEYAARGPQGSTYPWGETLPDDTVVCYGNGSTCPVKNYSETFLGTGKTITDPQSWIGVYDMAGNVWEWTDSEYQKDHSLPDKPCSVSCSIKGGSWYNTNPNYFRSFYKTGSSQDFYGGELGFRCAKTAEP